MFTLSISLDSFSTYIVAIDIIVLLSYVLFLIHRKRELEKAVSRITEFVTEYFMHTGVPVKVTCFKLDGNRRFVVLIESQPLRRFRFSNVLEVNLISHIQEITGNLVEKIYWRFTIQLHRDGLAAAENNNQENEDPYFSGGMAVTDESAGYNVTEASWDDYQGSKKEDAAKKEETVG